MEREGGTEGRREGVKQNLPIGGSVGHFTILNMRRINMLEADANSTQNLRIHQGISKTLRMSPLRKKRQVLFKPFFLEGQTM